MGDAVVVVDPASGISAEQFASWWAADEQARMLGVASVRAVISRAYGAEVLDWVVIPRAVNLASSAVYDMVKRLVTRGRPAGSVETAVE
ncbi:MAG TPA: hypothetical protein VHX38_22515, partial [Pseudonocardiaceae bacterium]|nr:hypothetical protein [Pseudonocardiaceae bacterium]